MKEATNDPEDHGKRQSGD
jgi:hypothetical protein